MILIILGAIDILIALLFFLSTMVSFIPQEILLFFGLYLIAKGVVFASLGDKISIIDIICGIILIIAVSLTIPKLIVFAVVIYLLQKGAFSLVR